nr:GntR family transcriptional regulator [Candidatus Pantoea persica]
MVREVIRYLEAEGLIESLPKKGPIVARLTWVIAEQINNIRLLLEQEAAFSCAQRAGEADKARLRQQMQEIAQASREHNDIRRVEASRAF